MDLECAQKDINKPSMTHRFPIKEIARQANVGPATVDRVLNDRENVSPQTRARVTAAISELITQEQQLSARGRRLFVDVVVDAPPRFSDQVRLACEAVLSHVTSAVFRPRFVLQQTMSDTDMRSVLSRILKRGSHGVILKARDSLCVQEMIDTLEDSGIPVVTLVTDILGSKRSAYVGIDNGQAGRTAAYLLAGVMQGPKPTILATLSQIDFQGEAARFKEFQKLLLELRPDSKIIDVTFGEDLIENRARDLTKELTGISQLDAVYSMGGGNRAILDCLDVDNLTPKHFIGHDLNKDNIALMQAGAISYLLHHDLKQDMREAFQALLVRHNIAQPDQSVSSGDVQIITPYNFPHGVIRQT